MKGEHILLKITILLTIFGFAQRIQAQDGQHVFVKYNLEKNNWKLDNYDKIGTFVTYPEFTYLRSWEGGNFDLYFSGIFSGLLGNAFITTQDDSLQITNITMAGFAFEKFFYTSSQNVHNIGIAIGLDFNGYLLTQGMESGKLETPPSDNLIAQVAGLGVNFGPSYMLNIEDQIVVDTRLTYQMTFNSGTANENNKTFSATGIKWFSRMRYYLNHSWVALADLTVERNKHDPLDINFNQQSGAFSYVRFGVGIGYQW